MNKELEIWRFAAEKLKHSEMVILFVVAESSGSSPGRQGFKMAVAETQMRGSIGGGVMETRLAERAKGAARAEGKRQKAKGKSKSEIQNPKSKIIELVHRRNSPGSSGMICSGRQTVIFFELSRAHSETVEKIIVALERSERGKVLEVSDSDIRIFDEPGNSDFAFERSSERKFRYREKLGFKNKLFIVGGGHCALALSELMSKMDFDIRLVDDRSDLNTLAKNEFVQEKTIIDSYEKIGDFVESGANSYVVVMTLGFAFDETVIRKLIDKEFRYFGVLGSRAKMATLLKNLERDGFSREKLNRIRAPIGLPINSRTPEEIAVSIAAEIIRVKNG